MGIITGFVTVTKRSAGLPEGLMENLKDDRIPRPLQPPNKSFVLMLDPQITYLIVELFGGDVFSS